MASNKAGPFARLGAACVLGLGGAAIFWLAAAAIIGARPVAPDAVLLTAAPIGLAAWRRTR